MKSSRARPTSARPPGTDYRGSSVPVFDPRRDPSLKPFFWAKFDEQLAGVADGTNVLVARDYSGFRHDLPWAQGSSNVAPTKATGPSGQAVVAFGLKSGFLSTQVGNGFPITGGIARPVSYFAVVKGSSSQGTGFGTIVGGSAAGGSGMRLYTTDTTGTFTNDGTSEAKHNGPSVNDDQWHVVGGVIDATTSSVWTDNYLTSTAAASSGTATILGLVLGQSNAGGSNQFIGQIGEVIAFTGRATSADAEYVTRYLADKWGVAIDRLAHDASVGWLAFTQPNGQNARMFLPVAPDPSGVLVLFAHQQAGTEAIAPSFWGYAHAHAAMAQGWYLAASAMHGASSWGNDSSLADLSDLLTYISGNVQTINKVILLGASMGALASALAVAKGTFTAGIVKGVYCIDGALSLAKMYSTATYYPTIDTGYSCVSGTLASAPSAGATSVSSTVSFPSGTAIIIDSTGTHPETVTTTGAPTGAGPYTIPVPALGFAHSSGVMISDYPTKTATRDPLLLAASSFAGVPRWRFLASANDTTVNKAACTDAFAALIASQVTEASILAHTGTHLIGGGTNPKDFVAFVKRCL